MGNALEPLRMMARVFCTWILLPHRKATCDIYLRYVEFVNLLTVDSLNNNVVCMIVLTILMELFEMFCLIIVLYSET